MNEYGFKTERFQTALIILSFLALFVFSFYRIDRSLWLDEANSVYIADHSFTQIIDYLRNDSSPPLYYVLLSCWISLFGVSELAVRSLSSLFYVLSVISIFYLGRAIYGRNTGLLCAFLYMLSSIVLRNAQNARMYSLLALLQIWSVYFFFRVFLQGKSSRNDLFFFFIINTLGIFTHYWFFFVIFSEFLVCMVLVRSQLRKFLLATGGSVLLFVLLWAQIFFVQFQNGSTLWMWRPNFYEAFVMTLIDFYNNRFTLFASANDTVAFSIYGVSGLLILLQFQNHSVRLQNMKTVMHFLTRSDNIAFFIMLGTTLVVPYLISQVKPILFVGRYTIIDFLPFVMLLASLLSRFASRFLLGVCSYVLLFTIAVSFVLHPTNTSQHSDKLTAEYLINHAGDGDIILFTGLTRVAIDYYLRLLKPDRDFVEVLFPSEIESHYGWRDLDGMLRRKKYLENEADNLVSYLCCLLKDSDQRIWLLNSYDSEIVKIIKEKLDRRFTCEAEKDVRGPGHKSIFVYRK